MRWLLGIVFAAVCFAQYIAPGPAGATGPAGPAGTAASAAISPWLFKPASASGTLYDGTPTLLDGTAISSALLAAPVQGQQMIFIPDVDNGVGVNFRIDGSTNRSARTLGGSTIAVASTLIALRPYIFTFGASNRWYSTSSPFPTSGDGSILITNPGFGASNIGVGPLTSINTLTNCSSSASPAVCAVAVAGSIAFPTGVTSVALTVNTTSVTANSQIFWMSDDTLGTKLGVTCNSTLATLVGGVAVTARTPSTSFQLTYSGTIATNPLCGSFLIVN